MSTAVGTWNVEVKTQGGQAFTVRFEDAPAAGFVIAPEGEQALEDVVLDGDGRVSFANKVDKPMKLRLVWDLIVDGDTILGTVKPGPFPTMRAEGSRVAAAVI